MCAGGGGREGRIIHTNLHSGGVESKTCPQAPDPCLFLGCLYSVQSVHLLCNSTPHGFQIKCPIPTSVTLRTNFAKSFLKSAIVNSLCTVPKQSVPKASSSTSTALAVNRHTPTCVTGRDERVEAEAKLGENPILEKIAINLASM